MIQASKRVAKDSCNFALNKGNSNESNIKIDENIANLFGVTDDADFPIDVKFEIVKNDYLISLCQIMSALPLYASRNSKSNEESTSESLLIHFSESLFNEKRLEIENFFGTQPVKEISAKLNKPKGHNYCLNFGKQDFSIRDFLVESRSVMIFKKYEGKIKLSIRYEKNDTRSESPNIIENFNEDESLQQIYYGAPGTGKSYAINAIVKKEKANTIRTTFHPDSDYASFVGTYKPTAKKFEMRDLSGHKVIENGKLITDERISYEFVSQAFLKAYVNAWKMYGAAKDVDNVKRQYLVIEEINRGNCAQIFGDLFQLLDRNGCGFSDYPIEADVDMKKHLQKQFSELEIPLREKINALYEERYDIVGDVLEGKILLLPNNLYIWATMNTSDQSLFPIDSAFKRRWDWKYMKIKDAKKGWLIDFCKQGSTEEDKVDWWTFIQKINLIISDMTSSADKQLGYFFCKPDKKNTEGVSELNLISKEKFVGKVLFYLWNDVFKDYGFDDADLFKYLVTDENGREIEGSISFPDFYDENNEVNEIVVSQFISNVLNWNKNTNA